MGKLQAPGAQYLQGYLVLTAGGGNPSSVTLSLRHWFPGAKATVGGLCPLESMEQTWALDFVIHHVTDSPSGFSYLCRPRAADSGGGPGLLPLLSPHVPL